MGFMQQFQQQPPRPQPSPTASMMQDRIGMLKSLVGGNSQALVEQLSRSNNLCRLPDGTTMTVSQVIQQCQGKTPDEAYRQLGLDFSQILPFT